MACSQQLERMHVCSVCMAEAWRSVVIAVEELYGCPISVLVAE